MKTKLSYQNQIEHLKSKGITFFHFPEEQALDYLKYKNNYFRVKSYCKNYDKRPDDTYIDLDFAYLVELAELDRIFRKYVLKLAVHLEHMLKLKLLRDLNDNVQEDGKTIVDDFLNQNIFIRNSISKKQGQSVCCDLIKKYENNFSVWNLVEVLSFGEFIKLYNFYYSKFTSGDNYKDILHHTKFLRNAVAHNNCLFNSLKKPYSVLNFVFSKEISTYIVKLGISPSRRIKVLENPILHDFITMIYILINICPDKNTTKDYLKSAVDMVKIDFNRKKEYYNSNPQISSRFTVLEEIVDASFRLVI